MAALLLLRRLVQLVVVVVCDGSIMQAFITVQMVLRICAGCSFSLSPLFCVYRVDKYR
jgi:hypothetical protein